MSQRKPRSTTWKSPEPVNKENLSKAGPSEDYKIQKKERRGPNSPAGETLSKPNSGSNSGTSSKLGSGDFSKLVGKSSMNQLYQSPSKDWGDAELIESLKEPEDQNPHPAYVDHFPSLGDVSSAPKHTSPKTSIPNLDSTFFIRALLSPKNKGEENQEQTGKTIIEPLDFFNMGNSNVLIEDSHKNREIPDKILEKPEEKPEEKSSQKELRGTDPVKGKEADNINLTNTTQDTITFNQYTDPNSEACEEGEMKGQTARLYEQMLETDVDLTQQEENEKKSFKPAPQENIQNENDQKEGTEDENLTEKLQTYSKKEEENNQDISPIKYDQEEGTSTLHFGSDTIHSDPRQESVPEEEKESDLKNHDIAAEENRAEQETTNNIMTLEKEKDIVEERPNVQNVGNQILIQKESENLAPNEEKVTIKPSSAHVQSEKVIEIQSKKSFDSQNEKESKSLKDDNNMGLIIGSTVGTGLLGFTVAKYLFGISEKNGLIAGISSGLIAGTCAFLLKSTSKK
jgi:hypothetical protein